MSLGGDGLICFLLCNEKLVLCSERPAFLNAHASHFTCSAQQRAARLRGLGNLPQENKEERVPSAKLLSKWDIDNPTPLFKHSGPLLVQLAYMPQFSEWTILRIPFWESDKNMNSLMNTPNSINKKLYNLGLYDCILSSFCMVLIVCLRWRMLYLHWIAICILLQQGVSSIELITDMS